MKIFLLSCFLFSLQFAFGQTNEFAPVGAKWWYSTSEFEANGGPLTITSIKDTIIESKSCAILIFDPAPNGVLNNDSLYVFQDSLKVYRYFPQFEDFYPLYDFTLGPGDSYFCYTLGPDLLIDSLLITIIDTATVNINTKNLKKQIVQTSGYYDWGIEIYETIGNIQMLVPVYGLVEIVEGPLRCYEDDNFGHYETEIVSDCDEITTILDLSLPTIEIYPNPAEKYIILNSEISSLDLNIYNLQGVLIQKHVNVQKTLDITKLTPGNYILHFQSDYKVYYINLIKI